MQGIEVEEALVYKATDAGIPLNGIFELTPLCNMNCKMCYARMTQEQLKAAGGIRSAKEWIHMAEEAAKAGTLFVLLTGGEPLLHPEFREIYTGLQKLGMIVSVNTNGTLLNEEWVDFFRRNPPRRINITVYGASPETYQSVCGYQMGYERALNGMRMLEEQGISVKMNSTIIRENAHEYEKMRSIARELGVYFKADSYMFPCAREGRAEEIKKCRLDAKQQGYYKFCQEQENETYQNYRAVAQIARVFKDELHPQETDQGKAAECRAGRSSYWLDYKMRMLPCIFMEDAVFDTGEGFQSAWEKCKAWVQRLQLYAGCDSCGGKNFCSVCAAALYSESGSYMKKPNYLCQCTWNYIEQLATSEE